MSDFNFDDDDVSGDDAPTEKPKASGQGEIVLTFKEGPGYDASWIVVHAGSVSEAQDILEDEEALKELLDKTTKVANYFRRNAVKTAPKGQGASAPAEAKQPPSWFPESPGEGWEYRTGFKHGKTWHAWAPPRGSDEKFQFHNPPK